MSQEHKGTPHDASHSIAKVKKDITRMQDGQPLAAAGGAMAGGIIAETVAMGSFIGQFAAEMGALAKKDGKTLREAVKIAGKAEELGERVGSNPKAIAKLGPLAWAVLAAPFVGAAVGAWAATAGNAGKIRKKESALDLLRANHEKRHADCWKDTVTENDPGKEAKSASLG